MADMTGYIKNLIPGKRYRMVVVAETNLFDPITLPSVEFVVPTAPDLISSYTPTGFTSTEPGYASFTIPTSAVGATADTFNITHWNSTNNSIAYTFWCNGPAFARVGQGDTIRVRNISTYNDTHQYYDVNDYVVVDKYPDYINVNARPTITSLTGSGTDTEITSRAVAATDWCEGRENHAKNHQLSKAKRDALPGDGWDRYYLDGQGLKDRNRVPNSATGTVYKPRIPAGERRRERYWQQYNVTVSVPDSFPLTADLTNGVVDVPIFAYKNLTTRTWHKMDHTPFIAIENPPNYDNAGMMNLIYAYNNSGAPMRNGVPLNETSLNVNRTTFVDNDSEDGVLTSDNHQKEYYFTVAKYVRNRDDANLWEGIWLQSEDSEPRVSDPEAIIWSQKAAGV
jgi:hypothetical protein